MSLATAHDRGWYAGLLPQIFCVAVILAGHEWRYAALAGGFAYAAAVFSFLGGVWRGQALASARSDARATTEPYIPRRSAESAGGSAVPAVELWLGTAGLGAALSGRADHALAVGEPRVGRRRTRFPAAALAPFDRARDADHRGRTARAAGAVTSVQGSRDVLRLQ